jgi:hypothetical protein
MYRMSSSPPAVGLTRSLARDGTSSGRVPNYAAYPSPLQHYLDRLAGRFSAGQIQPVEARGSTSSVNNSEGFFQLWILRGRSLISEATIAK